MLVIVNMCEIKKERGREREREKKSLEKEREIVKERERKKEERERDRDRDRVRERDRKIIMQGSYEYTEANNSFFLLTCIHIVCHDVKN